MARDIGQLEDTTKLLSSPIERDAFWEEHGYLFFRKVFDGELVEELRRQIVREMKAQGAVRADASTDNFTFSTRHDVNEAGLYEKVDYDTFWQSGLTLFETVLGGAVYIFRNTQMRFAVPQEAVYTTPPHQDGAQVPSTFRTVWVPLMDIPTELGGLAVADCSHKGGLRIHVDDPDSKSYTTQRTFQQVPLNTIEEQWLSADFTIGDAVIFHHWTLHRALPNRSTRVRLSVDTRFEPADAPRDYVTHKERGPDFTKQLSRYISEMPLEQLKKAQSERH